MAASAHRAIGVFHSLVTARSLSDADGRVWPFSDVDTESASMSENGDQAGRWSEPAFWVR
jgi:hypothetical protein